MADSDAASRMTGQVRVWDLPLRVFHWLLVAVVALAFLSSEEDSALNHWHVVAGWTAGVLIVFRLVWGFVGGQHSRFSSFVRPSGIASHLRDLLRGRAEPSLGHNPLGAISVVLLLAMIAATVLTGAALLEDAHELIGWTLLVLIVLHVTAVFVMSLLSGDNLVRAMVTGRKSMLDHPAATDARRPNPVALAVALVACAGAAFAIQRYDPLAFVPRSAENHEHGDRGRGVDRSPEARRDHDRD